MKLLYLLASLATAAPLDATSQSPAHGLITARGPNYCSPTGPESCNFFYVDDGDMPREIRVFDGGCGELVYRNTHDDGHYGDRSYSIQSPLPWTIELYLSTGLFRDWMGWFDYAGRRTQLRDAYCEPCNDIERCCRVAFVCH